MSDSKLESLCAELGLSGSSLDMLKSLPEAQRATFVETLLAVVSKKDERINGAVNNALSVVPLPLRGTVKKMLFH